MVKFADLFENEENPCRPWEFEKKIADLLCIIIFFSLFDE